MGRHSKEWNEGYQAAIEAIKKALSGDKGQKNQNGSADNNLPDDMMQPPGGNSGSSGSEQNDKNSDNKGQQNAGGSRTSSSDETQGVVRPEDCMSNNTGVENTPGTAGGFFSKDEGDKLAQSEGYSKDGGSESSVEQDWKDAALREANKLKGEPGSAWGKLKSTIEGIYKVQTDWKKAFKMIVGKSINDAEKRQAYANKNILAAQGRIARTDKDKFDNMDYMIAFIDSSGSMSDDQLKMVLSETYALALAKKPVKLVVIQCDTRIQEITEYKSLSELKRNIVHAHVKGRGGTDVKPLWDLLKTDNRFKKVKPDLIMMFTDGYVPTQYRRDRSSMNWLCWCIIDNPGFNVQYPDTMTKVIHIKSNDIV